MKLEQCQVWSRPLRHNCHTYTYRHCIQTPYHTVTHPYVNASSNDISAQSENLNSVKGLSVTVVVVLCSHLLCEGILPHSLSICFQIQAVLTWWVSWGTRAALLCAFPIGAAPLGTGIARKLLRKRQIIGIFKGAMLCPGCSLP